MKRFPPPHPTAHCCFRHRLRRSASYTPADFTKLYTPAYASGFDIRGMERNAATLRHRPHPWQGGSGVEQHLLVLREGIEPPAGFRRPDRESPRTPCGLHVVEPRSHVRRHRSDTPRSAASPESDYTIPTAMSTNTAAAAKSSTWATTRTSISNGFAAMQPDLMLLYGVTGENTVVTGKLRELGIPYIYVGDYMEESPLAKPNG